MIGRDAGLMTLELREPVCTVLMRDDLVDAAQDGLLVVLVFIQKAGARGAQGFVVELRVPLHTHLGQRTEDRVRVLRLVAHTVQAIRMLV